MELDMATIRKRSNGSYEIKVSCGYGVDGKQRAQYKTWKPEPSMIPKQIEKEVNRQAVLFEESCKKGQITAAVKFEAFAEQWFEEYAKHNLRKTSFERMRQLTKRVYPALGHLKLDKITARHIQQFVNDPMAEHDMNILHLLRVQQKMGTLPQGRSLIEAQIVCIFQERV